MPLMCQNLVDHNLKEHRCGQSQQLNHERSNQDFDQNSSVWRKTAQKPSQPERDHRGIAINWFEQKTIKRERSDKVHIRELNWTSRSAAMDKHGICAE